MTASIRLHRIRSVPSVCLRRRARKPSPRFRVDSRVHDLGSWIDLNNGVDVEQRLQASFLICG